MVTGVLALGHETVCFVSLGLGALARFCSVSSLEELAVILVDGCRCGARVHPCEATASGLLSLGSSPPSTGYVGGVAGPGLPGLARLDISLLPPW